MCNCRRYRSHKYVLCVITYDCTCVGKMEGEARAVPVTGSADRAGGRETGMDRSSG